MEKKIDELIKRIDALQTSINTLTALVNARLPVTTVPAYPAPVWPTPQNPPYYPPYRVTCKAASK